MNALALLWFALVPSRQVIVPQHVTPFAVGETFVYGGSYKFLIPISKDKVATLSVAAIDTVDRVPYWRFSFITNVSIPFYHGHSELISWTTVGSFISRHFVHKVDESGFSRHDDFHIIPDSGYYRNVGYVQTQRTPAEPLDDVAFFYYLRLPTTPLAVGASYRIDRYFRADRNPVIINVVRRDKCELPGDVKVQCLVLNPVVEDPPKGMFMKNNHAELWLTDDARRIPVRIKSGRLTLTLQKISAQP